MSEKKTEPVMLPEDLDMVDLLQSKRVNLERLARFLGVDPAPIVCKKKLSRKVLTKIRLSGQPETGPAETVPRGTPRE